MLMSVIVQNIVDIKLSFKLKKKLNVNLMSNTGVLAKSAEPEAHDKVLDNNLDRNGIWKCRLLRRRENRSTQRKTP